MAWPSPTISSHPADLSVGPQSVRFGVQVLGISAAFDPLVSVGNGSVGLGNHSLASVTLAGTMAVLGLSIPGFAPRNVSLPALGVQSVAIPGVNYTVAGVPLSIYVELTGSVNATTFVGPNGRGSGTSVAWTVPGSVDVPFTATGEAGTTVVVGVANLTYDVGVGVVAKGVVAGVPLSVNLIAPAPLPAAAGTPSTVVGAFAIVGPSPSSHPGSSLGAFELAALFALAVVGVLLGAWLYRRASARSAGSVRCPGCGRGVGPNEAVCPNCSRPLLAGRSAAARPEDPAPPPT